jgi:hypothetical protein
VILEEYAVHYNEHGLHWARNLRPPGAAEGTLAAVTDHAAPASKVVTPCPRLHGRVLRSQQQPRD